MAKVWVLYQINRMFSCEIEHVAMVTMAHDEDAIYVFSPYDALIIFNIFFPPFQGLLFLLCALSPQDVSKVRVGKLSPYGIETLRNIRDFLGVKFVIKPDPSTETVILKCVGCGMKNLSRKVS